MFDASRSSELQAASESGQIKDLQVVSESEDDPGLKAVNVSDFTQLLQAMQTMQTTQLQAIQEMQRESLKATVETLHHLAGVKAGQKAPRAKSGENKAAVTVKRSGSAYEEPIKALWLKNTQITAVEAGKKVGCSHVTAAAILKTLRGVKVTLVVSDDPTAVSESSVESESA